MSRQVVPRRRTLNSPLGLIIRLKPLPYFSVKPGSNEGLLILAMVKAGLSHGHFGHDLTRAGRPCHNRPDENQPVGVLSLLCPVTYSLSLVLQKRALFELLERLPELLLRIHYDRAVPRHRFLKRLS